MEYNLDTINAREEKKCSNRRLKVNGKGMAEAEPDLAILTVSVVTKDKNPQTAQNLNEEISKKLINSLLRAGISSEDIRTSAYTIFPDYDYVDGKQILTGYSVTHTLEIKVRDINRVGEILNLAAQNGVNQINSVEFTVEDTQRYYNRALKLAVRDAATKAQAITSAMKVAWDTIPCSVSELSASPTPFQEQGTMKLAAAAPVMPGKIEITASVEAEFEYWT